MTAVSRRSFLLTGGTVAAVAGAVTLLGPTARAAGAATSAPAGAIYVAAGQTYTVPATTRASAVTIEQGGVLTAPAGNRMTMTVNGVDRPPAPATPAPSSSPPPEPSPAWAAVSLPGQRPPPFWILRKSSRTGAGGSGTAH
jgi:hypothetical protein